MSEGERKGQRSKRESVQEKRREKKGNSLRNGGMAEMHGGGGVGVKGLQGCVGRELGY